MKFQGGKRAQEQDRKGNCEKGVLEKQEPKPEPEPMEIYLH
jgi:hypothetical protein